MTKHSYIRHTQQRSASAILLVIMLASMLMGVSACTDDHAVDLPADAHPIALKGINAVIGSGPTTRAVMPLVDSIGKYGFLSTDEIVFTTIERTNHPIRPTFSYHEVHYSCVSGDEGDVSWKREQPDADIYWSDGASPHTFIGYILPHADALSAEASGYDWHYDEGRNMYYGSIGNPTVADELIDYQGTTELGEDRPKPYNTELLRKEDLLLTYDTNMQNEDAMAKVHFHHGLASVRVVVTITGYSSTGIDPDAETKVTDMLLKNQPTMYKWNNNSYKAAPLVAEDQNVLNGFTDWGGTTPAWDLKKDMKLWEPRQSHGTGASRTFTFYGITAPGRQQTVTTHFQVTYPDPLNPTTTITKPYTAVLDLGAGKDVEFRPGYCTSININLNHKNEKMTVGAEYMSWQYVDQPDEGALRKNTTFLSYTDRTKVTIVGDPLATADDATWLYEGASGTIYDIYGNDGTAAKPYLICTADQLLSFAYEVKAGRDFIHKFVKLDADITMQPSRDVAESGRITWIGIGDATHAFNGFFLGSGRYINNLYGEHFFHTVGDNAVIDKLNFGSVIEVQGCGVVAHKNLGLICGCYIDGDVREVNNESAYTGSIVGVNESFIIACAHVGKVAGRGIIGGLVGFNNGTVMACYHAGEVTALDGSSEVHATVGKRGDGIEVVDGKTTNNSIMFSCYFDENLISHTPTLVPSKSGYPLSTAMMQSDLYVNGKKEFVFDRGVYAAQSQTLHDVLLFLKYGDGPEKDANVSKTAAQLMKELVDEGLTGRVNEVFGYHFSLNEALEGFRLWLNAMPTESNVKTNCHDFTPLQIQFLKQHYNAEHKFVYVPATYPKVQ